MGQSLCLKNEIEEHHKDEVPKKEMNIQTPAKFEQKNPQELKNFSLVMSPVDKMETSKKILDPDFSLSKPSKLTECSSKRVKVYYRPKT